MGRILFVLGLLVSFSATAATVTTKKTTLTKTTTTKTEPPPDLLPLLSNKTLSEPPATHAAKTSTVTTESTSQSVTTVRHHITSTPDWRFSAGPGMVFYGGNLAKSTGTGTAGYALNIGALTGLSGYENIMVGADLGFNSWSYDVGTPGANPSASGVQVLATVIYQFPSIFIPELRPFAGLSAGPFVYVAKTPGSNDSTLYLEVLLRPGLLYQASSELAFGLETKFGILGTDFVFAPQLNINLSL